MMFKLFARMQNIVLCISLCLLSACCMDKDRFRVLRDNYYGYIDIQGDTVISCEFKDAFPFFEGLAAARSKDQWGYLNPDGTWGITPQYKLANDFSGGLAPVCFPSNGKYGYINRNGDTIIEPIYDYAHPFQGDIAYVWLKGVECIINRYSLAIISFDGEPVSYSPLASNRILVKKKGLYGYIDSSGNIKIPTRYTRGDDFKDGLALVMKDGREFFIDVHGNVKIDLDLLNISSARPFSEGMACISKGDKLGYIDVTGKIVIPPKYEECYDFSEGVAVVLDKLYMVIDANGNVLFKMPNVISTGGNFSEGRLPVIGLSSQRYQVISVDGNNNSNDKNGVVIDDSNFKWGFIDKNGNFITDFTFDSVANFLNGLAEVVLNGKAAYINRSGQLVTEYIYSPILQPDVIGCKKAGPHSGTRVE